MFRVCDFGRAAVCGLSAASLRATGISRLQYPSPSLTLNTIQRREIFFFSRNRKLRQLEADANANPSNAMLQAAFLNELNKKDPHSVVRRFQSHRFACDNNTLREYISALVRTGAVDRMSLAQVAQYVRSTSPKTSEAASITTENLRTIMTDNIHVSLASPRTPGMMLWKLIRLLGVMGLVIGGIISVMGSDNNDRSILKSSNVHKEYVPGPSNKTFKDVRGMDESKEDLQDLVRFLKDPKKFTRLGGKLPKGYLLVGPPGTGKTLLAKAVAGEAEVSFLFASGSDFDEMFVGLGAKRIRALFEAAKAKAPCIVFIDEIDAVGSKRSPLDQSYARMSLNQLLVELDGFDQTNGVVVIGATNFPELLDPALVRPGRFDQMVTVGLPDVNGREDILKLYLEKLPIAADVDISRIARAMPGASGADLENVVNTAALHAAHTKRNKITAQDFDYAQDKVMMGPERKTLKLSKETLNLTAYHESGHALVAALTPGANQIRKATIMPRGSALGMVSYLQNEDQGSLSRRQMLAQIDVAMGGRVAEEIVFGLDRVTSGAASDIRMATRVARAMVTRYGMSDAVGFATTRDVDELKLLSEEQRNAIDEEVRKILEESHDRAKALLKQHEEKLHSLAQALLEKESMTAGEIGVLLGLQHMPPKSENKQS